MNIIDLSDRPISSIVTKFSAYEVLKDNSVETLIVTGTDRHEMYCESYTIDSGWKACAKPSYESSNPLFEASIGGKIDLWL